VPATGARTVRYRFTLGDAFEPPLRANIQLKHRRHRAELRAAACAATRSKRGLAFAAAAAARGETFIDGCKEQPITRVAGREVCFGEVASGLTPGLWSQLYDHALGLSSTVQERLVEAHRVAELSLANMPADQAALESASTETTAFAAVTDALLAGTVIAAGVSIFLTIDAFADADEKNQTGVRIGPTGATFHTTF